MLGRGMVELAQIDPGAGVPAGVVILCVFIVGPLALVLHFVLRRFRLVVGVSTAAFAVFLVGGFLADRGPKESTDYWVFSKVFLLGLVASLLISCLAGVPLLVARYSEEKRKRRYAPSGKEGA